MFVQMGLCFLKQSGASFVGGFEGGLTELSFELLSEVFDAALDLIEFVGVFVDVE